MELLTLEIQNFLTYTKLTKFDLNNLGLINVHGKNGQGKTSLYSAICWALYGKTLSDDSGDTVVNRFNKKDCKVSLTFTINDHTYSVIRTRLESKVKKPNDLKLFVDNTDITKGIMTDTQEDIINLVGMSYKTFIQSVMLHHGGDSFCSLDPSDQYKVLEDILDLSKLVKYKDTVKSKLKEFDTELKVLNNELNYRTEDSNKLSSLITKSLEDSKSFDSIFLSQQENLLNQKSNLVNNTSKLKETISNLKEEIKQLKAKFIEYPNDLQNQLLILTKQKTVKETQSSSLSKTISNYSSLSDKNCPTCTQKVDSSLIDNLLEQDKLKLVSLKSDINSLTNEINEVSINLKKREEINTQINKKLGNIKELLSNLKILEEKLTNIDNQLSQKQENPYTILYNKYCNDNEENNKILSNLSSKIKYLEEEIKYYKFLDLTFSNKGVKVNIIQNIVEFLNYKTQKYIDLLCPSKFKISFESSDKFKVNVTNLVGAESYHSNSTGERKLIDFAVGWALGDLAANRGSKNIRFKVVDELFEALDDEAVENCINFLTYMSKDYSTILVTTHNQYIKGYFNKEIQIGKR